MAIVNYNYSDLRNLARYTTGAAINHTDASFSDGVIGYGALMGTVKTAQGVKWLWKSRKDYPAAMRAAKFGFNRNVVIERGLKGKNLYETAKNFAKYQEGLANASSAAAGTGKLAKAGKLVKGNGGFFLISMLCESPEVYNTYKELGADHGHKQLAKSAAVIGAETVGYAVGAKAGAAAGAAIGTAIFPGIGTAVGAVVGVLTGLACSYFAGKGMHALVGKNEREIAKEDKARRIALQIKYHPEYADNLMKKARKKLTSEEAQYNPDSEAALNAYNKLASSSAVQTQNTSARTQNSPAQNTQSNINNKLNQFIKNINSPSQMTAGYTNMLSIA